MTNGAWRTRDRCWLPAAGWSQPTSNFCALRQSQGILHIHSKIPDRAFNLRMPQQNLDRTQISSGLVDDRCLCPPQGVGAVILARQADPCDTFIYQASVGLVTVLRRCEAHAAWLAAPACVVARSAAAAGRARRPVSSQASSVMEKGLPLRWRTSSTDQQPRPPPGAGSGTEGAQATRMIRGPRNTGGSKTRYLSVRGTCSSSIRE